MAGNKIRNWFENTFLEVKWFFQGLFRGYSDYDLIDYGEFACAKILPSLKAWVKHERHGYPSSFKDMEEWNEVLGKIVWAVEETATNKHDAVFLQVVTFSRNVTVDLLRVGQTNTSDFSHR